MSIKLNDSIRVKGSKPVEDKNLNNGVPYISVAQAKSLITKVDRYPSLSVIVGVNGINQEWWWKDGVEDTDLIIKTVDIPDVNLTTVANRNASNITDPADKAAWQEVVGTTTLQTQIQVLENWKSALTDADTDNIVDTITELINTMRTMPEGVDIFELINSKLDKTAVINSLNSIVTTSALSAAQGKVLNDLITGLNTSKEDAFTKNSAFNKSFGTTNGTVAMGNDARINNGQTAYSWNNHAIAGYLTDAPNDGKQYARRSSGWSEVTSTATVDAYTKSESDNKYQLKGTYLTAASLTGYATQSWVQNQAYLSEAFLNQALIGYATENWVGNQGYLKASNITGKVDLDGANITNKVTFRQNIGLGENTFKTGGYTTTSNSITLLLRPGGNTLTLNGTTYTNPAQQVFTFTPVTAGKLKKVIIYGTSAPPYFYKAEGVEGTEAVDPSLPAGAFVIYEVTIKDNEQIVGGGTGTGTGSLPGAGSNSVNAWGGSAWFNTGLTFEQAGIVSQKALYLTVHSVAQRDAIANKKYGFFVFLDDGVNPRLQRWNGTTWVDVGTSQNIGNTDLSTTAVRTFTQGFTYTHATAGKLYYVTGLTDKTADETFRLFRVQNADGQQAYVPKSSLYSTIEQKSISSATTALTLAELNAFGTERVDCPNMNRIYFKVGFKWTFINLTEVV